MWVYVAIGSFNLINTLIIGVFSSYGTTTPITNPSYLILSYQSYSIQSDSILVYVIAPIVIADPFVFDLV